MPPIVIASDHAGFRLKQDLKQRFLQTSYPLPLDLGCDSENSCDYPSFAQAMAIYLKNNPTALGILICGTGLGMSMAINRFEHIRAARCLTTDDAQLARSHNHANVVALSARQIDADQNYAIVQGFLATPVSEDRRHRQRVKMFSNL